MERTPSQPNSAFKLALAAAAAVVGVSLAIGQYLQTREEWVAAKGGLRGQGGSRPGPRYVEADDGRQLLWGRGPLDLEQGEWFDVTDSPLDPAKYRHGIGKDSIPAIDRPKFVAINDQETLRKYGVVDESRVIGYLHNGEAKAYPVALMDRHELVNDVVGGKPVTVGW